MSRRTSLRRLSANWVTRNVTCGAAPPSAIGKMWWIIESIWMFLMSMGAKTSRAAVAAPSSAYTELRPSRSSAWLGLEPIPSSATAAAARSDMAASLRDPFFADSSVPFAASTAWPVASAHSACVASSAAVSAGVGSLGSGPANAGLEFRYRCIAVAARARPSQCPSEGRASPGGTSLSPAVTRHDPPFCPSCAEMACAAMTRRRRRCASFPSLPPSASGNAFASSTNLSPSAFATPGSVRTIASQYGLRSLAQLVHVPNCAQ